MHSLFSTLHILLLRRSSGCWVAWRQMEIFLLVRVGMAKDFLRRRVTSQGSASETRGGLCYLLGWSWSLVAHNVETYIRKLLRETSLWCIWNASLPLVAWLSLLVPRAFPYLLSLLVRQERRVLPTHWWAQASWLPSHRKTLVRWSPTIFEIAFTRTILSLLISRLRLLHRLWMILGLILINASKSYRSRRFLLFRFCFCRRRKRLVQIWLRYWIPVLIENNEVVVLRDVVPEPVMLRQKANQLRGWPIVGDFCWMHIAFSM